MLSPGWGSGWGSTSLPATRGSMETLKRWNGGRCSKGGRFCIMHGFCRDSRCFIGKLQVPLGFMTTCFEYWRMTWPAGCVVAGDQPIAIQKLFRSQVASFSHAGLHINILYILCWLCLLYILYKRPPSPNLIQWSGILGPCSPPPFYIGSISGQITPTFFDVTMESQNIISLRTFVELIAVLLVLMMIAIYFLMILFV